MPCSVLTHREENQLLGALPFDDWRFIESHLEWVEMPFGTTLFKAGSAMRHVYFPTTAVVSLVTTLLHGSTVEVAAVGNEGLAGVDAFMGGGNAKDGPTAAGSLMASCSAIVVRGGHGYRMSAQSLAHQAKRSVQVMHHLLNYTRTLFLQTAQTSGCNRHHSMAQQFGRWLLVHLERQEDDELCITQAHIASLVGVRREGVTAAARQLQEAGAIQLGRGQITVIDRAGLRLHSCECHRVIREGYEQLKRDALLQAEPPRDGLSTAASTITARGWARAQ